jgi:uncharacterized membrane protein
MKTTAVYYEKLTEHINTMCGQNTEFWYVKAGGIYSNHWALKGYPEYPHCNCWEA